MNSAVAGQDRRLRHIDALRAIAALLVLWRHVGDVFIHADPTGMSGGHGLQTLAESIDVGRIGVILFFLISGFVIPFSIHPERPDALGGFLIKRFFRIFPAYWLSIPLGALTGYWIWGATFTARDFAINLTLLQDLVGARAAEGLYWTLLVEWTFYVLCAVLLLTRSLGNMRRVCALTIGLAAIYVLSSLLRWMDMPLINLKVSLACWYLSLMLCGTLYRTCIVEHGTRDAKWLRAGVLGLFAGYLVILPAAGWWAIGFANNAWISCAIGMLLFILGTSFVRVSTRLTDWLGRISYSIYLFHPVVFMTMWWWLLRQPLDSAWRTQHLGVYLVANALLTIGMAAIVYRFVEEPGIRLGRQVAERWSRRRQPERLPGMPAHAEVGSAE